MRKSTALWLASTVGSGLAVTAPGAASAQTAPSTAPVQQATAAPSTIGDIVVTARRREETLQNVPVTITALNAAKLEQSTLRSTEDLKNIVPGLNISGLSRDDANIYVRGQGPGNLTSGVRNYTGVATYFAEVPTNVAGPGVFYDLSSVQVLKGPQGTLFGRNTTGGAILFEPQRPEMKNEGSVQLQGGNYAFRQFDGILNVMPVEDKVALRIAGQVSRREGFTTSIYTGQKQDSRNYDAFRASLLLEPVGGVENLTIVDFRDKHSSGSGMVIQRLNPAQPLAEIPFPNLGRLNGLVGVPAGALIPVTTGGTVSIACTQVALPGCPTGPFGGALSALVTAYHNYVANPAGGGLYVFAPTSAYNAALALQQQIGPRKNQSDYLTYIKEVDYSVTNQTKVDVTDTVTLKNIIALRITHNTTSLNFTGLPSATFPILDSYLVSDHVSDHPQEYNNGSRTFSEEFQIQGRVPSAKVNYIIGLYYEHETPGQFVQTPGLTAGQDQNRVFYNRDTSKAVFGHLEWNPLKWAGISGGVRETHDTRFEESSVLNGFNTVVTYGPGGAGTAGGTCNLVNPASGAYQCPIVGSVKSSALTYDVTLDLKPSHGLLVYGAFRHGYKSGGVNIPAVPDTSTAPGHTSGDLATYKPEFVDEIEAGIKYDVNVGFPIRIDAAAFRDVYTDAQFGEQIFSAQGNPVYSFVNAARALNRGVEATVDMRPFKSLSLSGFFSYLDAHSTNTVIDPTGEYVVVAGRQVFNQPKYKYGFSGAYTLPLPTGDGNFVVSADYAWQSSFFIDNTANPFVPTDPGYGVMNARVDWRSVMGTNFDLGVFATNVLDKTYILGGYPVSQLGFVSAIYGEPRMVGGSVKYHF